MAISWEKKLSIITKGNATYEIDEDERGEILRKVSAIKSRLNEVEELVSIVEWITPHGHGELREHIADVEREAERLGEYVEGIIYHGKREESE